jgi:hypothetical protein
VTTVEFSVYQDYIKRKAKTKEGRKVFYYIKKINNALAKLGIKQRILGKYEWDEIYFLYLLMSQQKISEEMIVIKLIEKVVKDITPVWTLTTSPTKVENIQISRWSLIIEPMSTDIAGTIVDVSKIGDSIHMVVIMENETLFHGKFEDVIYNLMSIIALYKQAQKGGDYNADS